MATSNLSRTTAQMSFLEDLDAQRVSAAARKEARNREVHLPPISAFRWWARRTESVNGAILDAFHTPGAPPLLVVDPFAGGGTIPLAAVRRGHRVVAQDLNPWAAHGLASMFSLPPADEIEAAVELLYQQAAPFLQAAYRTTFSDGEPAQLSHTFRVATAECEGCQETLRLFPYAMMSLKERKERGGDAALIACPAGHLFQGSKKRPATCPTCERGVDPAARYTRRRKITCYACAHENGLSALASSGTWDWQVALVERTKSGKRELGLPTNEEIRQAEASSWRPKRELGAIPAGQESQVLLRHGFRSWEDLYPQRQHAVLEHLLDLVDGLGGVSDRAREALRLALWGTIEMAGHLSRWDRWYLKSYEGMAGHRFNFTTLAVEPNVWGSRTAGRGTFIRRIRQLTRAAHWLEEEAGAPLGVEFQGPDERIRRALSREVQVRVAEGDSAHLALAADEADLVLTDPPYHDDVQYGELSLPFRAWAGLDTARLAGEAVVNGGGHAIGYRTLLERIFKDCRRVLKPDGHLVFSYANREPKAWADVFAALQDAGFHASGFTIVHSENETDSAKRGVRACALDLIMDLTPEVGPEGGSWTPPAEEEPEGEEHDFLRLVGRWFSRVGGLDGDWEQDMAQELEAHSFLE